MADLTPAQVIEMVRARRGLEPGPPADVMLPNRNMVLPDKNERGEDEVQGQSVGEPGTSPLEPVIFRTATAASVSRPVDENEGVSLTNGRGYFMGHALVLSDPEKEELKSLLAGVVLRQLDEERAKIRGAKGSKR